MQEQDKKEQGSARTQPRTKEEVLARLIKEHPERAAQMLRQVLQGRDLEK